MTRYLVQVNDEPVEEISADYPAEAAETACYNLDHIPPEQIRVKVRRYLKDDWSDHFEMDTFLKFSARRILPPAV